LTFLKGVLDTYFSDFLREGSQLTLMDYDIMSALLFGSELVFLSAIGAFANARYRGMILYILLDS
jgi:hypothetical protein